MISALPRLAFVVGLLALLACSAIGAIRKQPFTWRPFLALAFLAFAGFELLRNPALHERLTVKRGGRSLEVRVDDELLAGGFALPCTPQGCATEKAAGGGALRFARDGQSEHGALLADTGTAEASVVPPSGAARRYRGPVPLRPGDRLAVGDLEVTYRVSNPRTGFPTAGAIDLSTQPLLGSLTAAALFVSLTGTLVATLRRRRFLERGRGALLVGVLALVLVSLLGLYRSAAIFRAFFVTQLYATAAGLAGLGITATCWPALRALALAHPRRAAAALWCAILAGLAVPAVLGAPVARAGAPLAWRVAFMLKELVRPLLAVFLSLVVLDAWSEGRSRRAVIGALAFALPASLLLVLQDDLGPILVFGFTAVATTLLVVGRRSLAFVVGLAVILTWMTAAPFAVSWGPRLSARLAPHLALAEHALEKLEDRSEAVVTGPAHSRRGEQQALALWGIRAGQCFGLGLGWSMAEASWRHLPNAVNDMVLGLIGAELGFATIAGVLLTILALGMALLRWHLEESPSPQPASCSALEVAVERHEAARRRIFDLTAAHAAWVTLASQALLNAAGVVAYAPLTGTTFPFLSAGGASLVASLSLVGIVLGASAPDERDAGGTP